MSFPHDAANTSIRGNMTSDEDFQEGSVHVPVPGPAPRPVPGPAVDEEVQVVMQKSLPRNSKNQHKMATEVRTPGQAIDVVCLLCIFVNYYIY